MCDVSQKSNTERAFDGERWTARSSGATNEGWRQRGAQLDAVGYGRDETDCGMRAHLV